MGKANKSTFTVTDGTFTESRTTTQTFTHAVLAERGKDADRPHPGKKGDTLCLRWSRSEKAALGAVKEAAAPAWGGAWVNVRVREVRKTA